MSFYTPDVSHPAVEATVSGVLAASTGWSTLATLDKATPTGVWVRNDDDTINILVRAPGSTDGITHGPGEDRFYPVTHLHQLQVSSESGTPNVSWWLG